MSVLRVEVVLAWPERFVSRQLHLPAGATVADAVAAAALPEASVDMPCAVHGIVAAPGQALRDGDRVELLRPLLADPKDARRRRAKPR
ncbi:RnfH family protein [Xanthomonas sp. AmX2]|uniref:RnfH family protein n=1 Tax=Xanthomonas sp. TaxID=29446 RepID=UPI0019816BD5|nr:RnfH family protein [Xanthomonas sp.]MBN6148777.1 RnfH family protein [Xanthomonas sp.]